MVLNMHVELIMQDFCESYYTYNRQIKHFDDAYYACSTYNAGKKCAEYNFLGYKVQRNVKVNCMECPSLYSSTETYQCKIVQKRCMH